MSELADRLRQIIQYAYDNAPAVKEIMDEAEVSPENIQTIADLDKVPVTSKDRLVELQAADPPFGGFLAVPINTLKHVFFSPGPLYEPSVDRGAMIETAQDIIAIVGFDVDDTVINTFSYHLIPTGLAVDQVLTEIGATVIPAGVGNADLQLKMMLDLGVTGYIGTPSWLMALIEKAEEGGLDFRGQFSLRKALVSAEPLPPLLRQTLVEKYGLSVTNVYGTAEVGSLAYDTEGKLAMHLLKTPIIQVVDPDTGQSVGPGETGEVVVTTFDETYPLIRLGTGDLAMSLDPAPGESRQEERSIILVGRVGDAVKVRGMFVHPNQLTHALSQVPGIARAQAVVTRPESRDQMTLRVVPSEEDVDRETLTTTLVGAVQSACRVKADEVEFIPASALAEDAEVIVDERTWA
ncbi:MAG: AMP-binding protein [Anaerolineae bacterium]|nr:AMP-binding protein [Anaerolineae bacterium]NIN96924.1 AMP-binding protein [Anaerolineae bacterium]NIQ79889.1 AMP-binding protein [Anaerolineae bacterium]